MNIDKNIQQQVISFLKWDEGQHAQFVYDCGIAYLENLIPEYPQIISDISKTRNYWNWWEKHWELRDMEWLEAIEGAYGSNQYFENLYKEHHDPHTLASAIYLNGKVLEESYANLISEITKDQKTIKEKPGSFRGHCVYKGGHI
jgi:hypothetical protein